MPKISDRDWLRREKALATPEKEKSRTETCQDQKRYWFRYANKPATRGFADLESREHVQSCAVGYNVGDGSWNGSG